jgi:DNA-directed RNA polymerase subunit RPC12/RpoP
MAGYKCKKCNTNNPVLQEWIALGISRVVTCKSCGHKMNLNLKPRPVQNNPGTQVSESGQGFNHFIENEPGTNVVGIHKKTKHKFKLQLLENSTAATHLVIKNPKENYTIFIGRNPEGASTSFDTEKDVSWILDDEYLSRAHCSISVQKQNSKVQFIIEDLKSTNGTLVNKNKLENEDQILLQLGDEVEVGHTVFTLIQD